MDFKTDPTRVPDWSNPQPEDIIEQLTTLSRQMRARDPRNWVFHYEDALSSGETFVLSEDASHDGKRHVFLNPKHQQKIDAFLATDPS